MQYPLVKEDFKRWGRGFKGTTIINWKCTSIRKVCASGDNGAPTLRVKGSTGVLKNSTRQPLPVQFLGKGSLGGGSRTENGYGYDGENPLGDDVSETT
ncbi:hypothetical protein STEG23_034438 [Scotinomys teguina]